MCEGEGLVAEGNMFYWHNNRFALQNEGVSKN